MQFDNGLDFPGLYSSDTRKNESDCKCFLNFFVNLYFVRNQTVQVSLYTR